MSSSVSLAITSAEMCSLCAAKSLTILKLKRINQICIGCLCLVGLSTAGISAYFFYKYWKLKKLVADLENNIEMLNSQFEYFDNEEVDVDSKESVSRTSSALSLVSSSSSDLLVAHSSRKLERKISRAKSIDNESDYAYETPSSSPERNSLVYRKESNKISVNIENIKMLEELDDNKIIDTYLNESYDSLKQICSNKQLEFEKEPENFEKAIDYIKSLYILGEKEINVENKKEIQFKAYDLAKRCLDLKENSYISQKWYAISTGRIVDYLSINEKVKYGFEFKKYLDKAIDLNQKDHILYYLRGRWSFKICNLSWAEKYGVRLVFGKVPDVTLDDAMNDFLKVEELNRNKSKGNLLHLAKCLIEKNQIKRAVEHLNQAIKIPARTKEHEKDNEEIQSLLNKYSK